MFPYATYFVALSVGQKLMLFGGFDMENFNPVIVFGSCSCFSNVFCLVYKNAAKVDGFKV